MKIRDNFKKGSVEMIILHFLSVEDMYGYRISKLVLQETDNYLSLNEGSLYPAFAKLVDRGMISTYKKLVGKKLSRTYYHLEKEGAEHLKELKKEFFAVNEAITKILNYRGKEKSE